MWPCQPSVPKVTRFMASSGQPAPAAPALAESAPPPGRLPAASLPGTEHDPSMVAPHGTSRGPQPAASDENGRAAQFGAAATHAIHCAGGAQPSAHGHIGASGAVHAAHTQSAAQQLQPSPEQLAAPSPGARLGALSPSTHAPVHEPPVPQYAPPSLPSASASWEQQAQASYNTYGGRPV